MWGPKLAIPLLAFWLLFIISCLNIDYRAALKNKSRAGWAMDTLGLFVQCWMIPLLQAYLLLPLYKTMAPTWQSSISLPFGASFLVSFVLIDYLYYWNHRTLHSAQLWPWHRAHHSARHMDIFVVSRNSLWTHLLICYVWVHSLAIFLLTDSSGYLLGIALSSALDLWRHSGMRLRPSLEKFFGRFLVLPIDHAWHHASDSAGKNFGANFNLWDKLHGSWQKAESPPFELGDRDHTLGYRDLIRPIPSQN